MKTLRITEHSIERFRERIEVVPISDETAVAEMLRCLSTADEKHLKNIGKRTFYIPTDRALFVGSGNAIVTILNLRANSNFEDQ